jgi:hypothetical protein
MPSPAGKRHFVCVHSVSVAIPYANANLRTPAKVQQAVIAQSTVHHDGSYAVSAVIDINGLSLTPFVTCIVKEFQRKYE